MSIGAFFSDEIIENLPVKHYDGKPGSYFCRCITCKGTFIGDKRDCVCQECEGKAKAKRPADDRMHNYTGLP